jgi:site-specific DNA-cytosine methylase
MKILELFCGTKSVSNVFKENGWEVLTVDNNPKHKPDVYRSILNLGLSGLEQIVQFNPDVIWASPPCTKFSIASCSHHWKKDGNKYIPRHMEAVDALEMIKYTLHIRNLCQPKYWFIENPRGMLRKMKIMEGLPRKTVTYCQYGDTRMKPTDIWTNCDNWIPRPMCKNGQPCHEAAPRGSATGTQGIKNVIDRSRIPRELCEEIYKACAGG